MSIDLSWRNNRHYRTHTLEAMSKCSEIVVFDTETTGFDKSKDRIIEVGAIKYCISETDIVEVDKLHVYIRPPFDVSEEIEVLTGITNEQLSGCPYEESVFPAIKDFFTTAPQIVVAHNASFDIRFMKALFERNCVEFNPKYTIDSLEMARDLIRAKDIPNYKLGSLASYFGLDDGISFHSAIDDVTVTAKLFIILYKKYLECDNVYQNGTIKPNIYSIAFWEGYEGFSRIYVQTNLGSVFYDIRRKIWQPKPADQDTLNMENIDMVYLENEAMRLTNTSSIEEFSEFKGRIKNI